MLSSLFQGGLVALWSKTYVTKSVSIGCCKSNSGTFSTLPVALPVICLNLKMMI